MNLEKLKRLEFLLPANEVCGKVIFLHLFVILFTGEGVCLSACWDTTPPSPGSRPPSGPGIPSRSRCPPQEQTSRDQAHPQTLPPRNQDQAHTPGTRHPWDQASPGSRHPLGAEHAGRYGQQAGGTHPTGMHACLKFSSIYKR